MDYNQITSFLDKFKKLIFQKEELKNIAIKIIKDEVNYQIDDNSLSIKNGFIYIKGSPVLRGEIMIHKKQILLKMKDLFPDYNFIDIK